MNLKSLFRPTAYYDLAIERSWSREEPFSSPYPLSWELDTQRLAGCKIVWPLQYQWPQASKWMTPIIAGLSKYVRIEYRDIPQSTEKAVFIELHYENSVRTIVIDYSDNPRVYPAAVDRSELYFKMQFHKDGYQCESVQPGGFITNDCSIYHFIPRLRKFTELPPQSDVYGRFTLCYGREVRRQALNILSSQRRFTFKGGPSRVRYSRFLRECTRSRINIDLPGEGVFCFRLIDYLAVGSCIVAAPHSARLPEPLVDKKHIVFTKPDISDLKEICSDYLSDDKTRREIAANAREYFDRYLHRDQLAAYYLHKALQIL